MSIPKIIHYCWFGEGKKSEKIETCLASQRKILSDYKFVEWNDQTTDFNEFPFLARARQGGNYAHLSDMVRLLALQRHGGFYLDTDVEVFRSFDPLLTSDFVCGYIWDCMLGTAALGSVPNHPILQYLLDPYLVSSDKIDFDLPNNHILTRAFIEKVDGFKLDGREWRRDGICVLDRFAFEQPSLGLRKNFAIHHASASWRSQSARTRQLKEFIIKSMGLYIYRQYNCWASLRRSTFRSEYEKARKETSGMRHVF